MAPNLSVIVPVYNAEKYLSRCIKSILNQNYSDIEVLLVNDGSTDSSGNICEIYAEKDTRIRVLHKENGGVSSARNLGLDNAKGEYITFVDADDWLENGTITPETFDGDYDVIRIPCNHCYPHHEWTQELICNSHQDVYNLLMERFCNACWGRLYRRKTISNKRFDTKIRMGEDILFFLDVLPNVNSYRAIPGNRGYHYFGNGESATNTIGNTADIELLIKGLLDRQEYCKNIIWSILYNTCYLICKNHHILYQYYRLFGFKDILFAPISSQSKKVYMKSKLKCILHWRDKLIEN